MKLLLLNLFAIFCLLACSKTKTVKLYDEAKVAKSEIAVLIIPNDIDLTKFNDENIDTPFTSKEYELQIPKGKHTLTAKYYCLWNSNSGENILLKSSKIKISFELEAGKTYRLQHKPLNNFAEALEFEKSPQFFIKEANEPNALIVSEKTSDVTPATTSTDKKSLDVLKLIWENSSEEDRREFLEWLKEKK